MDAAERGAEVAVVEFLKDPEGARGFAIYMEGLHGDRWDESYLEAVGQFDPRAPGWRSPPQVMSFMQVHSRIMSGHVAQAQIHVGATPKPDSYRLENAEALADLPWPFAARVSLTQNHAPQDGVVSWDSEIQVSASRGLARPQDDGSFVPALTTVAVPSRRVPLEIGTTDACTTFLHLERDGGLARWPYGHEWITLFVTLQRASLRRKSTWLPL